MPSGLTLAIDTGGTFTDLIAAAPDGSLSRLKVPSTPEDPARGVTTAIAALRARGVETALGELRHGTTIATNALLQRRGARVCLILTRGFEDLLRLRRQSRPDLYALHPEVPEALVPPADCLGIDGRLDATGEEIEPLAPAEAWIARHRERLADCDAVAVCLLHGYLSDRHEAPLAAALRRSFPKKPIAVASELVPLAREYERASTVAVSAYVAPAVARYLERLGDEVAPTPLWVMASSGGLAPAAAAVAEPVRTVLSGPAGGVRGAWRVGRRCGRERLLSLDMGGTSTDVSVVVGDLEPEDEGALGEHPLRVPLLPIETIGAGGGSIAYADAGGALRVGPRSAGAVPGPAAYGRGGEEAEPTVTDAHVVLGRLDALLGGEIALVPQAAHAAVGRLAAALGAEPTATARAILRVAEAGMARACKRVTMERGIDPRELTLVAFGGAGGLHACALAEELGCPAVIFPAEPGLLSAEGILGAPIERAAARSLFLPDAEWAAGDLPRLFDERVATATAALERAAGAGATTTTTCLADCRYAGQSHSLALEVGDLCAAAPGVAAVELRQRFDGHHAQRFGYALEASVGVELVAVRAFARQAGTLAAGPGATVGAAEAKSWTGPVSLPTYSATLWLEPGWRGERLPSGDILCRRVEDGQTPASAALPRQESLALEIHRQRLAAIAEEMGAALMRASFSANIKERRDYSCAVFDQRGQLLVQAAHIPVHLGSQQLGVEAAIAAVPMRRGQSVILNDPYAGGTHLPDVTLVTPVFLSPEEASPAYYVANRAHHADVGGLTPGSMSAPPLAPVADAGRAAPALTIDDEGWRCGPQPLSEAVRDAFARASRTPAERYADLRAQEAANHVGEMRLRELAPRLEGRLNQALLDYSERRMGVVLAALPDGRYRFVDRLDDDGWGGPPVEIPVEVQITGERAVIDFTAAPEQVPSALNAVRAITISAVFYVLRALGGEDLPANAGLLRPVEVRTRPGSICDARPPAAVAAGNVETSQRLVDALLGALAAAAPDRVPAASGGTMNNVLFGGDDPRHAGRPFVHYETLAVGAGASAAGPGASAIQVHVTNTLNTPCEELERSFPVRIEAYGVRPAPPPSPGEQSGGAGIRRVYRFLAPVRLTLLTERRRFAPWGLGGAEGVVGRNRLIRATGERLELPGKVSLEIEAGDQLIIETPGGGGWRPTVEPPPKNRNEPRSAPARLNGSAARPPRRQREEPPSTPRPPA